MKNVELLYPDFCNIYGESYNIEYLRRCNTEINVIETSHKNEPAFVKDKVDMVYLGCTTERKQEQIIEMLMPHRQRIIQLINDGTIFLVTGNSIEIFGSEIRDGKKVIPALDVFDFYSERYMERERHNSQYVGVFDPNRDGSEPGEKPITMLGHRSQFSFAYGDFENDFIDIEIGIGMNPDTKREGIRKNNFFATYSLGPCFIMNPLFAKYILRKLGLNDSLAFELEIMEAYDYRHHELRENLG